MLIAAGASIPPSEPGYPVTYRFVASYFHILPLFSLQPLSNEAIFLVSMSLTHSCIRVSVNRSLQMELVG